MMSPSRRHGVTIIEMLVSVAVITLLVVLLLPAVQNAREAARRTQCRTHLQQLGMAMELHHGVHGHYPTDGWGYRWIGDPDRGYGIDQPGGWVYNVLPFLQYEVVRDMGRGKPEEEKREALAGVLNMAMPVFHCPSRRSPTPYPYTSTTELRNVDIPERAAKSDYAVNAGDTKLDTGGGPLSLEAEDVAAYEWPETKELTGISYVRSQVRMGEVLDGLSNTYLIGEKYISHEQYTTGGTHGDDQSMFLGDDADIRRWTTDAPLDDLVALDSREHFGSAHSGGCHFVFCDGSIRWIKYDIDLKVHQTLGNRKDRQWIPPGSF